MGKQKKSKKYSKAQTKSIKKRIYQIILAILLIIIIVNIRNIYAFVTRIVTLVNPFSIQARYTITFDSNTGTGTMANQVNSYNVSYNLIPNAYTKTDHVFMGWNTARDGSGTSYYDKQSVRNLGDITLYAQWYNAGNVAEINGTYYSSLQAAVDAVPTDNTETTIVLLQNTSELVNISSGKNIVLNLQNYTVSNNGNNNILINYGTIKMISGTLSTDASTNGAVNNYAGATFKITGGSIISTGGRQTIYNYGGTTEISGTAYLRSTTNQRATVTNEVSGTVTITGGTIISTGTAAVNNNASTLTIGVEDGTSDITTPVLQGNTYGVTSNVSFDFYDGILKGKTNAVNDVTKLRDKEVGYVIANATETIDGVVYKTLYLGNRYKVTFNPYGGTLNDPNEAERMVTYGESVGTLPVATRTDYLLEGWFTAAEGGTQVTASTPITAEITLYARWADVNAAQIGGTKYETIQAAVSAVPTDGTQTTIKILRNVSMAERVTVAAGKNIVLDNPGYTISNSVVGIPLFEVSGTLSISNGTITSSGTQGAINVNNGGTLNVSGGTIRATHTRQGIYNNNGTVNISGTAYITASSTERAAVQNNAGTMNITGGTIISTGFSGVVNSARLTVGVSDGNVSTTSPLIQGVQYGVKNTSTFYFYDGIIKGVTDSINGSVTGVESGYSRFNSTEFIDGTTYKTTFLQ